MKRKAGDSISTISEPSRKKFKNDICDNESKVVALKKNKKKHKNNLIANKIKAAADSRPLCTDEFVGTDSSSASLFSDKSKSTSDGEIISTANTFGGDSISVKQKLAKSNGLHKNQVSVTKGEKSEKQVVIKCKTNESASIASSQAVKTSSKPSNASNLNQNKVEPVRRPQKPQEFSSNWKNLIKSGTVTYKQKKPSPTMNGKCMGSVKLSANSETKEEEKNEEVWFDDVDQILIEPPRSGAAKKGSASAARSEQKNGENIETNRSVNPLVKPFSQGGLTKAVAMDCEMVGVGFNGRDSILARVSLVNQYGQCVYDKFCRPTEAVTDYRTHVSGIRPEDINSVKAVEFKQVQKEVCDIIKDRIVVGHALRNDFKVLYLDHPRRLIRDTARYKPFRKLFSGATPSLKKLTARVLGVAVQEGEHNSVQDAQAAMRLYTMNRKQWESSIKQKANAAGLRVDKMGKKKMRKQSATTKEAAKESRSNEKRSVQITR